MMVMEANPAVHPHSHSPTGEKNLNNNNNINSPSSNVYFVGLEFVRQYYTVMNQGPLYLHRFYSDDSSFVHGVSARDSKVVFGQQEIHKRIQSLNFRNCHAKIRQVDSHETLGNGVVIQVTGELSNNGQPMRRFMQTFVLAPQSPKRYYVRNDIFHYQDEVFCDEEGQPSPPGETNVDQEEVEENEREEDVNNMSGAPVVVTSPTVTGVGPSSLENVINNLGVRAGVTGGSGQTFGQTSPGLVNDVMPTGPAPVANNTSAKPDGVQGKVNSGPVEATPSAAPVTAVSAAGPTANSVGDENVSVVSVSRPIEDEPVVINTNANTGSGPKTYANLFKSSTPSFQAAAHPPMKPGTNGPNVAGGNVTVSVIDGGITSPPLVSPQPPSNAGNRANEKGLPPRNPRTSGSGGYNRDRDNRQDRDRDRDNRGDRNDREGRQNDRERERREPRERLSSRSSNPHSTETGSIDGERSRPVNTYPDANQLFVGNLPHTVTPAEIKEIFSEFGEVSDVKIQKPAPKNSGQKVPYFAFVVFEDPSSAQSALKKPKITMKMSDGTDRRLNVEEKRSRPNMGNAGGGGNSYGYNRDNAGSNSSHSGSANQNSSNSSVGGGGSGHGRNYSGSYGDQQRAAAPTHSRTFRGSNRGGGGNQNTGGGSDRGGRGPGGHNNNSGNNSTGGGFQGGRASPNRNYNNTKR